MHAAAPGDSERDAAYMRRALALALEGWGQTAPNPMVGAVVVSDGEVVGEGFHARFGAEHAEVAALRAAGPRARGATVYVSLEPCAHHGKTPPCADALIAAGVARVVAATRDPNPDAVGGVDRLAAAGVAVTTGVEGRAARELNAPFFFSFWSDRPWVTLKLALSLDGAVTDASRSAGWLTGPETRREVHRLRAGSDAVAVGAGTALADDPLLTVRDWPTPRIAPLRLVFDSSARLPLDSRLVRTAGGVPTAIVAVRSDETRAGALRAAGVAVHEEPTLAEALRRLRARGVRSMLVEGGARIAGALLERSLVDRLVIFQAPIILGRGALNAFAYAPAAAAGARRLDVLERRAFGADLMTIYSLTDI